LCFSLSHSGHLALFALARGPLGVDLELGRRWVDEPAVAARALSHEHADRLARLPATRRREEFLRLWARHEAAVKLGGTGIWSTPASEAPWVIDLDPGEGAAALAAAAAPRSVRCWTLPG
jgi:4'-phosphopantetheinyl transferase